MSAGCSATPPALEDDANTGTTTLYEAGASLRGTIARRSKVKSCLIFNVLLSPAAGTGNRIRWKVVVHKRDAELLTSARRLQPGDEVALEGNIVIFSGSRGKELNFEPSSIHVLERSSAPAGDRFKSEFARLGTYPPLRPELRGPEEPIALSAHSPPPLPEAPLSLCRATRRGLPCTRSGCRYRHAFIDGEEERAVARFWRQADGERNAARALEADDPHAGGAKSSKAYRASIFARWLVETYGAARLSEGAGVCEVAGGQGFLSHVLREVHGVASCVVDPRREDASTAVSLARGLRKLLAHGTPRGEQAAAAACGVEAKAAAGASRHREPVPVPSGRRFGRIEVEFAESLLDEGAAGPAAEAADLLRRSSIIIGLHPDQATEPIARVALRLGIPFAIVPCCVFPNLFPARRLPGGGPVVTYPHFLEYLKALTASDVRESFLPFQGRNRVLWTAPPV